MMSWLQQIAGRSQLAVMWLAAVAIGAVIYFLPIARVLQVLRNSRSRDPDRYYAAWLLTGAKRQSSFASFAIVLALLGRGTR